ncbi:PREDICTED: GATA transcription factor 11-like [Tarenaya hassleriana]|uniref:GATA transcription factor 11-like n=1 Tax=Tarenaya hassleriana TaxID=28532 RepID=UPI00053C9C0C|nr:PREDICTED: GATA transcription factor 11-like [Tarenaya hassleriana]XP_010521759.1 PREDICTED: GATA transcription factor 11-like [Tarenaya hassleriana]XP_019056630.1 PREDICTED: GATA transcription factor 11-like [Tarenaya hassleriana]
MNNGPWLPEVDFQGLSDDFFDDLMNHTDFPLEDVESGNGEGDWDAGFQGLEPPPMDMFSSLSSGFNCGGNGISKGDHKPIPILKQCSSSEASSDINSSAHGLSCPDVKVSKLFQSSSPVSVLENSSNGSFSSSQSSRLKGLTAFPVKGMRSKRKRPTALKLKLLLPFELAKSQQFTAEAESESEIYYPSEKPAKKKRKKHKKIIHPTHPGSSSHSESGTTRKCTHCETTKTPQWREGPNGPKTLCNACGVRFRSGRLVPEYRPAASPTFIPSVHSNSHRKIVEMRRKGGSQELNSGMIQTVISRA